MKRFNTTAVCIPSKHYMVDLTERVAAVRAMVEEGDYFCINRARQYGKTTLLNEVRKALSDEYEVCSLDFQGIGSASYQTEELFCQSLAKKILRYSKYGRCVLSDVIRQELLRATEEKLSLVELFEIFRRWCSESGRPLVLMIDEVDTASNYRVFLDFLANLRESYINRDSIGGPAFQSVILAGVTDIKHLRSKMHDEDEHKANNPWNIAADFRVTMSFDRKDVSEMLKEYEEDHYTGMNPEEIAGYLIEYTNGYPYLVSRLCQIMDERLVPDAFSDLSEVWTKRGVNEAVKRLVGESSNCLFSEVIGIVQDSPHVKKKLWRLLMDGEEFVYDPSQDELQTLFAFDFLRIRNGNVAIANKVFEMRLYNLFKCEQEMGYKMLV